MDKQSAKVHEHLSGGEKLSLKYRSSVNDDDVKTARYDKLTAALNSEIEQGFCLHGPHREDIAVSIDGDEIKAYSSQGQIRTAMLSLKLATLGIAKADFDELPVLLLDDVFSELDHARQRALLEYADGVQCYITTAVTIKSKIGSIYTVGGGNVKKES